MRPLPAVALLAAMVGLAGCGVFTPREPEPPDASKSSYTPATEPSVVVDNMRSAVTQLSPETYRRSISSEFSFTPAAPVASGPVWDGWGTRAEQSYFSTLAGAAQSSAQPELTLEGGELVSLSASRYTYEARYTLRVPHARPGEAPTFVEGRLRWVIVLDDDEDLWFLDEWSDFEVSDEPTWSRLKAAFYE